MEFVNLLVENVERVEERFLSVLDNLSVEEVNAFPYHLANPRQTFSSNL